MNVPRLLRLPHVVSGSDAHGSGQGAAFWLHSGVHVAQVRTAQVLAENVARDRASRAGSRNQGHLC